MACVLIDPDPGLAHDLRASEPSQQKGGIKSAVVRRGRISSAEGFVGRECLIREVNPIGEIFWSWTIQGKLPNQHAVYVGIEAPDAEWKGGADWRILVESMGSAQTAATPEEDGGPKLLPPSKRREGTDRVGALIEFPHELTYLLNVALGLGQRHPDELNDDPHVFELVETALQNEMRGLTKKEAKGRVKKDRERLIEWLHLHPPEKYPETALLPWLAGVLVYAPRLFEK